MSTITIRPLEEKDNPELAVIIRNAFTDYNAPTKGTVYEDLTTDNLYELFKTPGSICWVAEADGQLAGCCGLFPTPGLPAGCVELVKLYLSATSRGKGLGKALFTQCLQSASDLGYTQIYLESLPQFGTAVKMYEQSGFTPLSQPLGNTGHCGCNIWMVKNL